MKLYATIEANGKRRGAGSDEYIYLDIQHKNSVLAELRVIIQEGETEPSLEIRRKTWEKIETNKERQKQQSK